MSGWRPAARLVVMASAALLVSACGSDSASEPERDDAAAAPDDTPFCERFDEPCYPEPAWFARESENYARTTEAPGMQASDPNFQVVWNTQSTANRLEYSARSAEDPHWSSGENACASWAGPCTGDPFRYPGTDPFYDEIGAVTPVNFYDSEGARLSGRVWAPRDATAGEQLPAVVIINGSVQAPETLYWWAAQQLVRNGYLVLTFDPRGQGRSDSQTPDGQRGSNINSVVFRRNLIDAIDFFYSTPDAPYPHNLPGSPGYEGDAGEAVTTPFNPIHDRFDRDRLGVAGHSLGATGVSVVQGEQPWPGTSQADNPIDAVVAWDNLSLSTSLDGVDVVPRVPAMGQAGDYFLAPAPLSEPPDLDEKRQGFLQWQAAGVPSMQVNIRGGTHYEWSLLPGFPATAWQGGDDEQGWSNPLAQHYTLAWFDRWLKQPGEPGYETADARLLADDDWRERLSVYYRSSRDFPLRDGQPARCGDLLRQCPDDR